MTPYRDRLTYHQPDDEPHDEQGPRIDPCHAGGVLSDETVRNEVAIESRYSGQGKQGSP
jgi:hypothetical protein